MNKRNVLRKLTALMMIAAMLLISFPAVFSEGEENVTDAIPEEVTEVTVQEAETQPEPEPAAESEPEPTEEPTPEPTEEPTPEPTEEPTPEPTEEPTPAPTEEPTPEPTEEPTPEPTEEPTPGPTEEPTPEPTQEPEPDPVVTAEIEGQDAPELITTPDDDGSDEGDGTDEDGFDEGTDFEEFEDWDAGYVSEELLEQFNAPSNYEQIEFSGSAEIVLKNEGDLRYGDEIILEAKVDDDNLSYRLVWEAKDDEERGWYMIGSGDEFSYTLTAENVDREFRVVVFTVD